jgi:hypothetical protein
MLNAAQEGLFVIENDSALPAGSEAIGVKPYGEPATTFVAGDPEIFGGDAGAPPPAACATVMVNAGSVAEENASRALMTILLNFPTLAAVGVPLSWPVLVLKVAHEGLLLMENQTGMLRGAEAVGLKA